MKGDFTRDTFDATKHFSRVLMQQGRVTLDADYNEQVAILLHYIRTLARDLIGPYAAPVEHPGFVLMPDSEGMKIGTGRYYVDGILIENDDPECSYTKQPDYQPSADDPLLAADKPGDQSYWFYLDVWERLITHVDDPSIREKALNGPDTCARAQVIWQVKGRPVAAMIAELEARKAQLEEDAEEGDGGSALIVSLTQRIETLAAFQQPGAEIPTHACAAALGAIEGMGDGTLTARVDPGPPSDSPCAVAPDAKYRGTENHLYRVEVHQGGAADVATIKWSRDNGSAVTAWLGTEGHNLQVANVRGFAEGNWVELTHKDLELRGEPGVLVRLVKVSPGVLTVDPAEVRPLTLDETWKNAKVRRWDQIGADIVSGDGTVAASAAVGPNWLTLEDGVQVQLSAIGTYRTGDYWLIPARVATGGIEWPANPEDNTPLAQRPHGVQHHYAPLGFFSWGDNQFLEQHGCQCRFNPQSSCFDPNAPVVDMALEGAPNKKAHKAVSKPAKAPSPSRSRKKPAK